MRQFFVLGVAVSLLLAAAAFAEEKGKSGKDSLEGTWKIVSVEINKRPLAMEKLLGARLVVKGASYSFKLGDVKLKMTHKIDAGKKPKTLDMTLTEGPEKGRTYHAIYKLEGDTLTICRSVRPDKERPTEFGTKPDSGLMLIVWKRADAKADAVTKEMAKFQGTWKFVSLEVEGKKKRDEDINKYTVVLKGDQWTVSEGDKIAARVTFKLDPSQMPKAIDLVDVDKKRLIRGIYSFKGDTLTVCDRGAEKGERPSEFGTKPNSGFVQFVLKRVKP